MKVMVAGATGAIGKPLVRQLVANNHEVLALVRGPLSADVARGLGAQPVECDVLDARAVKRVIERHRPGAVVSELTSLPKEFKPRRLRKAYAANNRVRLEGTRNLLLAAQDAGASKFVAQSAAFWYKPTPGDVKSEEDPLWTAAPEPVGEAVRTMVETEQMVLAARGPRLVLLRYGTFYGPGTWFSPEGTVGRMVRKRQYPVLGDGAAVTSFVHVDDAAAATVAAIERPVQGIFNVTDDEPARTRDWLPFLASTLGAKPPRRAPAWLGRLALGSSLAEYTLNTRGASNQKAKRDLRWTPRYASWRQGFVAGFGDAKPGGRPVIAAASPGEKVSGSVRI